MPSPDPWQSIDRDNVRGWLEDAFQEALGHNSTLPDSLIANAQTLGMRPIELRIWIYDQPQNAASADALARWAAARGFARAGVNVALL